MKLKNKINLIDQCVPGMILAAEICNQQGNVLLPAGTELTISSILSLKKRSINHVVITIEDTRTEEEVAAKLANMKTWLDFLFRKCGENPELALLQELIFKYRSDKLA